MAEVSAAREPRWLRRRRPADRGCHGQRAAAGDDPEHSEPLQHAVPGRTGGGGGAVPGRGPAASSRSRSATSPREGQGSDPCRCAPPSGPRSTRPSGGSRPGRPCGRWRCIHWCLRSEVARADPGWRPRPSTRRWAGRFRMERRRGLRGSTIPGHHVQRHGVRCPTLGEERMAEARSSSRRAGFANVALGLTRLGSGGVSFCVAGGRRPLRPHPSSWSPGRAGHRLGRPSVPMPRPVSAILPPLRRPLPSSPSRPDSAALDGGGVSPRWGRGRS